MHPENRRKNARLGTHPRPRNSSPLRTSGAGTRIPTIRARRGAFTMIELGIAVLIFTLIAGVATLAVARAQLSAAKDRFSHSAEAELTSMLAIVATGPYDNLVDGTFLRPDPCTEAVHLSCPEIHGRTLTVTWEITGVADPTGDSTENIAGVLVGASVTLPYGGELSRERFVPREGAGAEGTTLVRVNLTGVTYTGPVYLMTASGNVAGSAIVDGADALIRSDVDSCTTAAPCRLALRPDGSAVEGSLSLDHGAVAGTGIILDDERVTETGASVRTLQELHVLLLAENEDGRRAWADTTGSVCLYLSIPTADGTVEEPACNTESADRVIWRTYRPDPTNRPNLRIALPTGAAMDVRTDPETAACAADGQQGWSSGTWASATVCTGWTWGSYTEIREGITAAGTSTGTVVELAGSGASWYTAVWTAGTGYGAPAAGRGDDDLWAKPRDVPACAATATCTAPVSDPETSCPTGHCNSSRASAPVLLQPRRGTYRVAAVTVTPGSTSDFTVDVADTEGDAITVNVSETVSGLAFDGEAIADGDVVADGITGPAAITFEFEPGAGFTSDTVELTLTDGGAVRTVEILLTALAPAPWEIHAAPVRIEQNGSATTRLLVVDDAGEGAASASIAYTTPAGIAMGTPALVADGVYAAAFTAAAASAGTTSYTLTAGAADDTAGVTVVGVPGTVSALDASHQQGSTGTLGATVNDATGNPLQGAHVWFELSAGAVGTVPLGAYPVSRGCITDAAGTCDVDLTVEQNAVDGTFTITARSGDAADTATLTVTESMAKILSDGIELEQGSSAAIEFTAYNGRNEPAAGIAFTATTNATGASVTASGTTDAEGTATLTVTLGTGTPTGELVITIDDGANQHQIRVRVISTVASVDVPAAAETAQYGNGTATVTARNAQGDPVPYAALTLTPESGIFAPATVMTGTDGTALIAYTVGTTTAVGTRTIGVSYGGVLLAEVEIEVVTGIANLTTASTLKAGAVRTVRLTIADNDGGLIGGRDLTLVSVDSRIDVAVPTVRTNLFGYADFTVSTGNVPASTYEFTVNVDGRTIPLTLRVEP